MTIALEHDRELVIGVTYDPTRNELFSAEKGQGASPNFKPIHVSTTPKLSESLVVTGFPYDFKDKKDFSRHLTAFLLGASSGRSIVAAIAW